MKIVKNIKVCKENITKLESLPCVDYVRTGTRGRLELRIHPEYTEGNNIVQQDDFIVQYETGKWQRFGQRAMETVCMSGVVL